MRLLRYSPETALRGLMQDMMVTYKKSQRALDRQETAHDRYDRQQCSRPA